jgi:cytochrome c biogenesis factor
MRIFGGEGDVTANRISIVIAIVAALYVTIYTPVGITMGQYFSKFFAISSIWMVGIIVFLMIFGLFMFLNPEDMQKQLMKKIGIIAGVAIGLTVVTWFLSGGLNLFTKSPVPWLSKDDMITIIILVAIGGVIFFATREGGTGQGTAPKPS